MFQKISLKCEIDKKNGREKNKKSESGISGIVHF